MLHSLRLQVCLSSDAMEMRRGKMSTAIRLLRVVIQLSRQNNFPQAFAFSVDGVKHFIVHLTMQITSALQDDAIRRR